MVAGLVSVATLVVIAGIIYQVVRGKNSVPLAQTVVGGSTTDDGTLFKSA